MIHYIALGLQWGYRNTRGAIQMIQYYCTLQKCKDTPTLLNSFITPQSKIRRQNSNKFHLIVYFFQRPFINRYFYIEAAASDYTIISLKTRFRRRNSDVKNSMFCCLYCATIQSSTVQSVQSLFWDNNMFRPTHASWEVFTFSKRDQMYTDYSRFGRPILKSTTHR